MVERVELKVGLFLLISLLLIGSAVVYVAYRKGVFTKEYIFTLSSKSGEDLTEGMPVVFSGFKIGVVSQLELTEDGSVFIKIKIPEKHIRWIRSDSTFIVNKPIIGQARIVVVTENLQSPLLSPEQIPEVTNVSDIKETITKVQPLLDKVTKIASHVEKLTAGISDPEGNVQKSLAHIERFTANFSQKKTLLEMAVSDREAIEAVQGALKQTKDLTEGLENLLAKIDKTVEKTDAVLVGEEGIMPTVLSSLRDILSKLKKLDTTIDNINKISTEASRASEDLKVLRAELDDAVEAIGELAREIEKKIPFKEKPEIKLP